MQISLDTIKSFLMDNPLRLETVNSNSFLEDLYWHYTESNPPISDKTKKQTLKIREQIRHLPVNDADSLYNCFNDLYDEQNLLAFRGGLIIGMRLILELAGDKANALDS